MTFPDCIVRMDTPAATTNRERRRFFGEQRGRPIVSVAKRPAALIAPMMMTAQATTSTNVVTPDAYPGNHSSAGANVDHLRSRDARTEQTPLHGRGTRGFQCRFPARFSS
jgi:hypothetical protein